MRFLPLLLLMHLSAGDTVALYRYAFDVSTGPPNLPLELTISESPYHLIHLSQPMNESIRAGLRESGLELVSYLPTNCFVVRSSPTTDLDKVPFIDWHGPFQPAYKIHPDLDHFLGGEQTRQTLLISLHGDADMTTSLREIRDLGGRIVETLDAPSVKRITASFTDPQALHALAAIPQVRWLSPPLVRTPRNDRARWLIQSYQAPGPASRETPLYDQALTGRGEVVGLVDTTPDLNHCLLLDPEGDPPGPDHRKFVYFQTTQGAMDHGTHVSSTLAGKHFLDHTEAAGMAYDAQLAFTQLPGNQSGTLYDIFNTHASMGAAIHSNSWGSTRQDYTTDCVDIDAFTWDHEEALVLFACVNDSEFPLTTLDSPENALNVLAVGAAESAAVLFPEVLAERHGSCARGPVPLDLRRKPELFAPGESLQSAFFNTACGLDDAGGTSTATPVIAGGAALVRQYFRAGFYPTGRANSGQGMIPGGALLKAVLLLGSVNMIEENEPSPGVYEDNPIPNDIEGWGRIHLDNSLYLTGDPQHLRVRDVRNGQGLVTGTSEVLQYQVLSSNEALRICLSFHQPPGDPGTLSPVTNDLDLVVIDPTGQTYLGNVMAEGQSQTGGTADPRNNVEMVRLNHPLPGTYEIRIEGRSVNIGPQGFALAVSGDLIEADCDSIDLDAGDPVSLSCWGTPVVLGEGLPHGLEGSLVWSPGVGLDDPTARTPVATPAQTTTYTVTATLPNGCIKTKEVTITVPPMDLDGNQQLDAADLLALIGTNNWGHAAPDLQFDYNGDRRFNLLDLLTLQDCF